MCLKRPPWSSVRWTSHQACVSALHCQPSRWLSTSATFRTRTCCSSSTTSSVSCRRVQRCQRCSAVCHQLWVTSQRSLTRWVSCRSALPQPEAVRLRPCRPCTCPLTTTPTLRHSRPSRTLMQRLSCPVRSQRSVSTLLWTRWRQPRRSSHLRWLEITTTTWLVVCRRLSSAIRNCKTSSQFSVLTNFPKRTVSP